MLLGGPLLLDSGVGPLRHLASEEPRGLGWAYLRICVAAGRVCFDRPTGPLWVLSLVLSGPTAGLDLPGHTAGLPGPAPDPVGSLWVRAGGTRSGGPGADFGGVQEYLGDDMAVGAAGESRNAAADNQGEAPTVWAGAAASTKRRSSLGLRKSSRLASRPGGHALTRAMSRKAAQRDDLPRAATGLGGWGDPEHCAPALVPTTRGGPCPSASTPTIRTICELCANCGVQLSDAEAASLASFLQAAVASV